MSLGPLICSPSSSSGATEVVAICNLLVKKIARVIFLKNVKDILGGSRCQCGLSPHCHCCMWMLCWTGWHVVLCSLSSTLKNGVCNMKMKWKKEEKDLLVLGLLGLFSLSYCSFHPLSSSLYVIEWVSTFEKNVSNKKTDKKQKYNAAIHSCHCGSGMKKSTCVHERINKVMCCWTSNKPYNCIQVILWLLLLLPRYHHAHNTTSWQKTHTNRSHNTYDDNDQSLIMLMMGFSLFFSSVFFFSSYFFRSDNNYLQIDYAYGQLHVWQLTICYTLLFSTVH